MQEKITDQCPLLTEKLENIPKIFQVYIKNPRQYICGKNLLSYYLEQQKQIATNSKNEPIKIISPPKIKNLLKKGEKKKNKFKEKVNQYIFGKNQNISLVLGFLYKSNFLCYDVNTEVIGNNLGLFLNYDFYNPEHNLFVFLEYFFQPGESGKLSGYFVTDKEPFLENKIKKYKE